MRLIRLDHMSEEAEHYLSSCARIRHISTTRLLQRMLKNICDDQLVLGILDDDSRACRWMPGESCNSHYREPAL